MKLGVEWNFLQPRLARCRIGTLKQDLEEKLSLLCPAKQTNERAGEWQIKFNSPACEQNKYIPIMKKKRNSQAAERAAYKALRCATCAAPTNRVCVCVSANKRVRENLHSAK